MAGKRRPVPVRIRETVGRRDRYSEPHPRLFEAVDAKRHLRAYSGTGLETGGMPYLGKGYEGWIVV